VTSDRVKRLTLVAHVVGSGIALLDSTIVNVALPAIERDLGGGLAGQQWVVNGYMLVLGSLILVANTGPASPSAHSAAPGMSTALIEQPRLGRSSPAVVAPLVAGLALLAAFLAYEGQSSPDPMLPLDLFRRRNFWAGNVETLAMYGGLSILFFCSSSSRSKSGAIRRSRRGRRPSPSPR
jgi:hypothetical protein